MAFFLPTAPVFSLLLGVGVGSTYYFLGYVYATMISWFLFQEAFLNLNLFCVKLPHLLSLLSKVFEHSTIRLHFKGLDFVY